MANTDKGCLLGLAIIANGNFGGEPHLLDLLRLQYVVVPDLFLRPRQRT